MKERKMKDERIKVNRGASVNSYLRKHRVGRICNLCGHFGFMNEMTHDERMGGDVHWSCKKRWEWYDKNEQHFEAMMDAAHAAREGR